jgi:hypothetical protein
MTCAEFQEVLPELMEGQRNVEFQAHLKSCPSCSELVSELNAISEQSRYLQATAEPDPRVWRSIETRLRREGLIREPQPRHLLTFPARGWRSAAWLVPLAAALLVGVAFLMNRSGSQQQALNNPRRVTSQAAPVEVAAVDLEDDEVLAEVGKRAPAMEAAYAENLKNVNAYIHDAQQTLAQNPDDDEARQYLLEASQQKAMLYDMALDRSLP